jgi:predicted component of type VI protein secretion system
MEVADQSFQLVVRKGPRPGRVFALSLSAITVGRDPLSDIVIDDPEVSRHHARLQRNEEGYSLQDMGSTNGTFVDGKRLGGDAVDLKAGQVVMFGSNVTLIYQATSSTDPLATMVAPTGLPDVEAAEDVDQVEEDVAVMAEELPVLEPPVEEPSEPEPPPVEPFVAAAAAEELVVDDFTSEEPIGVEFQTQEEPLPDLSSADVPAVEPEIVIAETEELVEEPLAEEEGMATMLEMPQVEDEPEQPVETPSPFPSFDDDSAGTGPYDEPDFEPAIPPPVEEPKPEPVSDSGEPLAEFDAQPASTPPPAPPPPPVEKDASNNRNRNIIIAVVVVLLLCCCLVTLAGGGFAYLGNGF